MTVNEVTEFLQTSKRGLVEEEAVRRLGHYGPNALPQPPRFSYAKILWRQLSSSLVMLLLGAGTLSLVLGKTVDAVVIFLAVAINTIMGFVQELKAETALAALSDMIEHKTLVIRDGVEKEIEVEEVTIGDLLVLKPGAKVAADARVLEEHGLEVDEAILTGESAATPKQLRVVRDESGQTRSNMVYMGTTITDGRAFGLVVAVGQHTAFGQIAALVAEEEEKPTPLQSQLSRFINSFTKFTLFVLMLIVVVGVYQGIGFFDIFMTAIAIAVAAIPEGLLVAVTVILAIGMQKMLRRGSLIRRLLAVETLGSVNIICTDKTGTLTKGEMQLDRIVTMSKSHSVTNSCRATVNPKQIPQEEHLLALQIAMICNDAVVENPAAALEDWTIHGNYTERALLFAGKCAGIDLETVRTQHKRLDEIPFNSENKFMATLNLTNNEPIVYLKGAAEEVIGRSTHVFVNGAVRIMNEYDLRFIRRKQLEMSRLGLRVLAVAYKEADSVTREEFRVEDADGVAGNLVFVGLMALKDPLRVETYETIRLAKRAGIRTVIITGDNLATARAVAQELGMKVEDSEIIDGDELDRMNGPELMKKINKIKVFARVSPHHKSRIVDAWQTYGAVVAMTGDGVNDAPALRKADVGIALGSGTDATKETADMVLLDNNFKTIISAVEQGRTIFENIRKVILYLVSDSFSELIVVIGSLLLGLTIPLTAPQILWINLITDGLPNIALAFEPGEKEAMQRPPRSRKENLLNQEVKTLVIAISLVSGLAALVMFHLLLNLTGNFVYASSVVFSLLAVDSLFYVFSIRSLSVPVFARNPFSNLYLILAVLAAFGLQLLAIYHPFLQTVLHTQALAVADWGIVFLVSTFNMVIIEIVKYFFIVKNDQ